MEFNGIIEIEVRKLGLSQIYLNSQKLSNIKKWFNPDDLSNFEPLPVRDYGDGRLTLTDGHSRAYVAFEAGIEKLPVCYDNDDMVSSELSTMLYKEDILWCKRFGINGISDLCSRIVSDDDYKILWLQRCQRAYNLFAKLTLEQIETYRKEREDLFLYGMSNDSKTLYFEDKNGISYELERDKI